MKLGEKFVGELFHADADGSLVFFIGEVEAEEVIQRLVGDFKSFFEHRLEMCPRKVFSKNEIVVAKGANFMETERHFSWTDLLLTHSICPPIFPWSYNPQNDIVTVFAGHGRCLEGGL